ncbi:MAG: hypothetical protein OIF56_02680 [Cohaesibacter sp.]|nr:hypothetical protein [Cohaesibacter sp.]MCV6600335.1 hypothetical protein [Cohaesibacter sp.]
MKKANKSLLNAVSAFLCCNMALMQAQPVAAFQLSSNLANRTLVCKGGSENRGADYRFLTKASVIERVDGRFPNQKVYFPLGAGHQGQLQSHWSYETLSQEDGRHVLLYERLSLRSPVQTQHIYRTYELFSQNNKVYVTIYDGVNGARDWRMKVTRECYGPGWTRREKLTRKVPNRYWNPQN